MVGSDELLPLGECLMLLLGESEGRGEICRPRMPMSLLMLNNKDPVIVCWDESWDESWSQDES
jgi:hypothetical protein